jgi:hypothetical protein
LVDGALVVLPPSADPHWPTMAVVQVPLPLPTQLPCEQV